MKLPDRVTIASLRMLVLILMLVLCSCSKDESSEKTGSESEQVSLDYDVNGPSPKISFPETSYDFGKVPQGAKVSHTFIVQNTGKAPLKLIRAKGS